MFFEDFLTSFVSSDFFQQPIDQVLLSILIWFGWIPIAITLLYGFVLLFQNSRQGKYWSNRRWVIIAISVPAMTEQTPKALENLFANLYGANSNPTWKEKWILGKVPTLFSFEIASTGGFIAFYVRCETRYRDVIEAGIYAHYPDAEIIEVDDYASIGPDSFPDEEWDLWGSELTLKNPTIFPIKTYVDFEDKMTGEIKDPLGQILELLSKMKTGENFWIQMMIRPNGNDWKKEGEKFIAEVFGKGEKPQVGLVENGLKSILSVPGAITEQAFNVNISDAVLGASSEEGPEDDFRALKLTHIEREQADGVLMKISKQGFECKLRLVYMAKKGVYNKAARTALVKGMYNQYSQLNLNSIGMFGGSTPRDDYFWQAWTYPSKQGRLLNAYRGRSWGVGANPVWFNSEELASLWHFPAIGIKAPLITKSESRRGEPPVSLPMTGEADFLPNGPVQFPGEESVSLPIITDSDENIGLPGLEAMESALIKKPAPSIEQSNEMGLPQPKPPVVIPSPTFSTTPKISDLSEHVNKTQTSNVSQTDEKFVIQEKDEVTDVPVQQSSPPINDEGVPPNLPF